MKVKFKLSQATAALTLMLSGYGAQASFSVSNEEAFDMASGKAYVEIVIPHVVPALYQSVSPSAGDATLVLRVTAILTNAWYDSVAPYHSTAVGVYSDLGRRPDSERLNTEKMNVASLYASYRVLMNLLPQHREDWRRMLTSVGLDPDDNQENKNTAIGIGNLAAKAIIAHREKDGMNQLGTEGGRKYNPLPYADYLNYQPANTPYQLLHPSRWQPSKGKVGIGIYRSQHFVTPQLRVTKPYSYNRPDRFRAPPPVNSDIRNYSGYKNQVDDVLRASAQLNDERKMAAELFDDKIISLATSGDYAVSSRNLSLFDSIHYEFLDNLAAFDTSIATWDNKFRFDAVRPFSAIAYIYRNEHVTAWGGPGKGTVNNIPANQWRSYLNVADHPEYPSGSASFCGAHAEIGRLFFKSDELNWTVNFAQGSSQIEPGITPQRDMSLHFRTWTDFEITCGLSRLWGGVHFPDSLPAGRDIGHQVAKQAYKFVQKHVNGKRTPGTD